MDIQIHRGARAIGGSVTEISTNNTHLFVDFGCALPGTTWERSDAVMVDMLCSAQCNAVLFSHYHGDHVGLLGSIPARDTAGTPIELWMGETARRVLLEIHITLGDNAALPVDEREEHQKLAAILRDRERCRSFENGRPFTVGELTVTPLRVDHSAWDAYLFLIEGEGKTVVHTGDFRAHGRMGAALFDELKELLRDKTVDALITEGTMLSRRGNRALTEPELEEEAFRLLQKPENKCAFLLCSSTNMESLASFANAAQRLGRTFYVNQYVYRQIRTYRDTAGRENRAFAFQKTYPLEDMRRRNPKLGMTQPEYMKEHGFLLLTGVSEGCKKWQRYFEAEEPLLIYSLWGGYVDPRSRAFDPRLGEYYNRWPEGRRCSLHTGGHAVPEDLRRMILTARPQSAIVPIHSERPEALAALDIGEYASRVRLLDDGEALTL